MESPYTKSGMNNQKAAFLKNALKTGIIDLPHVSKSPYFKLVTQESFEGFTWCSCKSNEEHEAKREAYEKSHPLPPEDYKTIKHRTGLGVSENTFIDILNINFDKNKEKIRLGIEKPGRRPAIVVSPKYLITQEDKQNLERKGIALVCDYLRIKEKDLIKFFEENKDLTNELLESLILSSLPSSLKEGITEIQLQRRCRMMIEERMWLN